MCDYYGLAETAIYSCGERLPKNLDNLVETARCINVLNGEII